MGLPEGWTKYGADGEEILSSHRYRALGNAIALPCAEYIMAGIAEALTKGGANDGNEQGGFRLIEIIAPKYSGRKRV